MIGVQKPVKGKKYRILDYGPYVSVSTRHILLRAASRV